MANIVLKGKLIPLSAYIRKKDGKSDRLHLEGYVGKDQIKPKKVENGNTIEQISLKQ